MNNLLAIRKRLGLSQVETANSVGVTQSAISQYEVGACDPSLETARRLIEFARTKAIVLTLDQIYAEPEGISSNQEIV